MLDEVNNFFRYRRGLFGNFEKFKSSGIFYFYEKVFGECVFTEDTSYLFIGVGDDGYFYDEIYYPYDGFKKVGTIIPKKFLAFSTDDKKPDPIWKNVAEKGYAIVEGVVAPLELSSQARNEAFIPYGINTELNMSKTVNHAYFGTQANYEKPELHRSPSYMKELTRFYVDEIPRAPLIMRNSYFQTADIVRYSYDQGEDKCIHGPYRFHMDYFPRLMFMFFTYFSKTTPIEGRELLVGKRKDFDSFTKGNIERSSGDENTELDAFSKLADKDMESYETIPIDDNTFIIMNTLNPIFLHRVQKLKHENEVVLLTHYLWARS